MTSRLDVYVHGGMFKTGTSAFQKLMRQKTGTLLSNGILYPTTVRHGPVLNVRRSDWTPGPLQDLAQAARQQGAHKLILSGEAVSILSPAEIETLRRAFDGCRLHFVFSFRHWADYLPSRWAQYCMRRDSQSFPDYLAALRRDYPEHIDFRFDLLIGRFRSHAETFQAISYSNEVSAGRQPNAALMRAMGLDAALVRQLSETEQHVNTRADWTSIELFRLLNGAVADLTGYNHDDIFTAIGSYGNGNIPFQLPGVIGRIPPDILEGMKARIRDRRIEIELSGRMDWIADLEEKLQSGCLDVFAGVSQGRIFTGDHSSRTVCSDLHWSDIRTPDLDHALAQLDIVKTAI